MTILTLNAGSSSLKYQVFSDNLVTEYVGQIDAIGQTEGAWLHKDLASGDTVKQAQVFKDHLAAMQMLSQFFAEKNLQVIGVGHRVVHGGTLFSEPTVMTDDTIMELETVTDLAPLHNPANVLCIKSARTMYPDALHVAVFDTAFHQSMPAPAYTYAIQKSVAEKLHVRRYGFHGTSYQYVTQRAADYLNKPLEQCQFIACHLGNGASVCAIKNGKSIDTSMGFTPLAGLVMGTRSGDIDPAIVSYFERHLNQSASELDTFLNKQSGLLGLCGTNDMREIEQRIEQGDTDAKLAFECFIYRLQSYIGAYLAQLDSLDAIIFTGGIGENSSKVREDSLASLKHLGFVLDDTKNVRSEDDCIEIQAEANKQKVLVIKTNEELQMAKLVKAKL